MSQNLFLSQNFDNISRNCLLNLNLMIELVVRQMNLFSEVFYFLLFTIIFLRILIKKPLEKPSFDYDDNNFSDVFNVLTAFIDNLQHKLNHNSKTIPEVLK